MLTDEQFKFLMNIEKIILDKVSLPVNGERRNFRLSKAGSFRKIMDLHCISSDKNRHKYSYTIVYRGHRIFSIDLQSQPHTNPDGTKVGINHMHIYKEGFGDKYAYDLSDTFPNPDDFFNTFYDILEYSKVINRDEIQIFCQGVLFHGAIHKSKKMGK